MGTNKSFLKKILYLLAVMALISIVGTVICLLSYRKQPHNEEPAKGLQVVTSFHPMYILTKNLLRYSDTEITNMTGGLSGCIHDYQVTTEDMRKLSKADIFVVNGMGMESFLSSIARKNKDLTIFAASGDLDMEEDDDDHHHEENGHLWMDPSLYLEELNHLHMEFTDYFMKKGQEERVNGLLLTYREYGEKVLKLVHRYNELAQSLPDDLYVICYNEAFEIFAEGLGLNIIAVFSLDEDEMLSPGEIADAIKEARKHDNVCILIEKDLAYHANKVVKETGASVVYIDPLTGGDDSYDSYINGMTHNIDAMAQR